MSQLMTTKTVQCSKTNWVIWSHTNEPASKRQWNTTPFLFCMQILHARESVLKVNNALSVTVNSNSSSLCHTTMGCCELTTLVHTLSVPSVFRVFMFRLLQLQQSCYQLCSCSDRNVGKFASCPVIRGQPPSLFEGARCSAFLVPMPVCFHWLVDVAKTVFNQKVMFGSYM